MHNPNPEFAKVAKFVRMLNGGGTVAQRIADYKKAEQMMKHKPSSWRLRFFNWLAQGKIQLEDENKVSTNAYQSAYGQLQTVTLGGSGNSNSNMNLPGISFKITNANGGTIISVRENDDGYTLGGNNTELYIIPDGVEDFDRELGKIITMYRMKK
jgi:hypothetical protein